MKTKKEKQNVVEIDKPMTITIESINRHKIQAVLELSRAVSHLARVLAEDDVNINVSNCTFTNTTDSTTPSLSIQTKID